MGTSGRDDEVENLCYGRGRERGQGRGRVQAGVSGDDNEAGNRASDRGRGRGRDRNQLVAADGAAENQADHEQQIVVSIMNSINLLFLYQHYTTFSFIFQNLVRGLGIEAFRGLAIELLQRQPAAFADIVNWEVAAEDEEPPPNLDPPQDDPNWCNCGRCLPMPTQEEKRCCTRMVRPCTSTTPLFQQIVLDANVLDIAMHYREDMLVLGNVRNNENFRHAAYRQYVLWQHGLLGRGSRRVLRSCCVLAICTCCPSPNGVYTGYRPARL